jgi:tRNA dimethylallyltransferase
VVIFLLNCDLDVLGPRLDSRIDDMLKGGLLDEIKEFYATIKTQLNGQSIAEYSSQFQHGIFQSIGFKEFDNYLKEEGHNDKEFKKSIEEMKANTRRYAKKQLRWVMSRFVKSKINIRFIR